MQVQSALALVLSSTLAPQLSADVEQGGLSSGSIAACTTTARLVDVIRGSFDESSSYFSILEKVGSRDVFEETDCNSLGTSLGHKSAGLEGALESTFFWICQSLLHVHRFSRRRCEVRKIAIWPIST